MSLDALEKEAGRVTSQIVEKYRPEKVVLFGSVARGNRTPNDIDLFVIKKTSRRRILRAPHLRKLVDCRYPLDLIVKTPSEVSTDIKNDRYFIKEVLAGKVLYDKAKSRLCHPVLDTGSIRSSQLGFSFSIS